MKNKLLKFLPWVAVSITLVLLSVYPFIPEQHHRYYPTDETFGALYAGSSNSKSPHIDWVGESKHEWRCDMLTDPVDYQYCGVGLLLTNYQFNKGRNFKNIQRIQLKASYSGNEDNIRFVIRNFDPVYANGKDNNSPQYIYTEVQTKTLNNEFIDIYITEFTVADWWIAQYDHPRSYIQPNFDNVISLGFELSGDKLTGSHVLKIDEIILIGPVFDESSYYLTILLGWLMVQFTYLITRLNYVKNAIIHYQHRDKALVSENAELHTKADKYKKLSSKDALTGIYNRRGFNDQANPFFEAHFAGALLLIDLDHFKQINDNFGHDAGDIVLKTVSQTIIDNVRKHDVVGRWGGEEFIVYVGDSYADSVLTLAEKLRHAIKNLNIPEYPDIAITTSIGFAIRMQDETFDDCFKRADIKLYSAKTAGRDQTKF